MTQELTRCLVTIISHAIQAEIYTVDLHHNAATSADSANAPGDLSTGPVDKPEEQATVHRISARLADAAITDDLSAWKILPCPIHGQICRVAIPARQMVEKCRTSQMCSDNPS